MLRGMLHAIVILVGILWIGTSLAPLTTELARAAGFRPDSVGAGDYELWSGVALGSHLVPWIVLQLFQPGTPGFWVGLAAAVVFGAAWFWVRDEIRATYPGAGASQAKDESSSGATKPENDD
jgi:PTS system galactitol-specific IIC component